jgi:hypothetical protein
MTPRDADEYRALRATIAERGTARIWIFAAGFVAWAGLALATTALGAVPLLSLIPLLVLAAVFEAVFALHVAVERVGRYLQIFHDDTWEHVAMSFGPPLAGTGTNPLFLAFFALATVCNFATVLAANPVRVEWATTGGAHVLFLVRLFFARHAAARQRSADRVRFEALRQDRDA